MLSSLPVCLSVFCACLICVLISFIISFFQYQNIHLCPCWYTLQVLCALTSLLTYTKSCLKICIHILIHFWFMGTWFSKFLCMYLYIPMYSCSNYHMLAISDMFCILFQIHNHLFNFKMTPICLSLCTWHYPYDPISLPSASLYSSFMCVCPCTSIRTCLPPHVQRRKVVFWNPNGRSSMISSSRTLMFASEFAYMSPQKFTCSCPLYRHLFFHIHIQPSPYSNVSMFLLSYTCHFEYLYSN